MSDNVLVGRVTSLQSANSEKYGVGAWLGIGDVSVKVNVDASECPAVGTEILVFTERRGKMVVGLQWGFLDVSGKPFLISSLDTDKLRSLSDKQNFAGGITR